jgi:enoyl-CoA hydratase/carnithine racemase
LGRCAWATRALSPAGLINVVVDPAALEEAVLQAAREIAALPAGAVALARKLMRGNLDDILRRVDTEAMYFKERLQSDEARAAFAAFFTRKK